MNTIKFLPINEFKILKVIQVIGPEWNKFWGYLPYLRNFRQEDYQKEPEDELDNKILSVIRQNYAESTLSRRPIYFEDELENVLKTIEGGVRKNITIQFFPLIPFEVALRNKGESYYAYAYNFEMRLLLGKESEKLQHINNFYVCDLPLNGFEETVKSIHPI